MSQLPKDAVLSPISRWGNDHIFRECLREPTQLEPDVLRHFRKLINDPAFEFNSRYDPQAVIAALKSLEKDMSKTVSIQLASFLVDSGLTRYVDAKLVMNRAAKTDPPRVGNADDRRFINGGWRT